MRTSCAYPILSLAIWHSNIIPISSLSSSTTPSNTKHSDVLCVGETLWDGLPLGLFLGGAPTNVAIHLSELNVRTSIAARVGDDALGKEAIRRLDNRGVHTALMQRSAFVYRESKEAGSTGLVVAEIDKVTRDASYVFDTPSAWDYLEFNPELEKAAEGAKAVVVGTIASRLGSEYGATTADAVQKVCRAAGQGTAGVVLDVNLRPPWYTPHAVLNFAECIANHSNFAMLKLNDDELPLLESWCGLSSSPQSADSTNDYDMAMQIGERAALLGKTIGAKRVCVTRGSKGAVLYSSSSVTPSNKDQIATNPGFVSSTHNAGGTTDTVGAGDSFLAALIKSLLLDGQEDVMALKRGCALGGYVAQCQGAVPSHEDAPDDLRLLFQNEPSSSSSSFMDLV
mmetsp:Transcript_18946/g.27756  ORF Transcript_18946/g.27756 Transcript_18946/m.27756 type:complete len:397 (-) Transcript_18946:148-1338(-)